MPKKLYVYPAEKIYKVSGKTKEDIWVSHPVGPFALSNPCDDCPWVEGSPKHKLTYQVKGVRAAVRNGSKILCHARAGHPVCVGAVQWRKKQQKKKRKQTKQ